MGAARLEGPPFAAISLAFVAWMLPGIFLSGWLAAFCTKPVVTYLTVIDIIIQWLTLEINLLTVAPRQGEIFL